MWGTGLSTILETWVIFYAKLLEVVDNHVNNEYDTQGIW